MRIRTMLAVLLGSINLILFQGCDNSSSSPFMSEIADSSFVALGMEITDDAFKVLSGHLGRAMGEGGVPNALEYCNENAIPLTDSLSELHGVILSRTALRTRNDQNKPSDQEKGILKGYEKMAESDGMGKFTPEIRRDGVEKVSFYRPIYALGKCMACHGTPGVELAQEHLEQIRTLYPSDQATNFKPGDLRGMWVVEFSDPGAVIRMLEDTLR